MKLQADDTDPSYYALKA